MAGMSQEDFDRLCRSIDKTVSQISRLVGKGIDGAGDAIGDALNQAYEKHKRSVQPPAPTGSPVIAVQQPVTLAQRFRSSAGLTAGGVGLTVAGSLGTFSFGTGFIIAACMVGLMSVGAWVASLVSTGAFLGLSIWGLVAGIRRLRIASQFKAFKRIFGTREVCSFSELAGQTQTSRAKTLAASRKMLSYGLLPEGHIDDEDTCLMVTNGSYHLYRQAKQAYEQRLLQQREQEKAKRASTPQGGSSELPAEAQAFIEQGNDYLQQLRALDTAIADEGISAQIVQIEDVVARILQRVADAPSVLDGLGRLMEYYLPTTVKLLVAYDDLEEQPVQGENIASSRKEIEQTLGVLCGAYEKLLDATFQDLSLDVSADISVLHAMLAQEGLTDGPFDAK